MFRACLFCLQKYMMMMITLTVLTRHDTMHLLCSSLTRHARAARSLPQIHFQMPENSCHSRAVHLTDFHSSTQVSHVRL